MSKTKTNTEVAKEVASKVLIEDFDGNLAKQVEIVLQAKDTQAEEMMRAVIETVGRTRLDATIHGDLDMRQKAAIIDTIQSLLTLVALDYGIYD